MNVNWFDQWSRFAPGFKDGVLPLDLKKFKGKKRVDKVLLVPGPGFGDFSHPTTQLTLSLLSSVVEGRPFLDIGCGSGILSLVAYALYASEVVGVDIDPEAVNHASENAKKNGWPHLLFSTPLNSIPSFSEGVIAMNMISSEQEIAWQSLPRLEEFRGDLILSGLLEKEKEKGITRFEGRGWKFSKSKKKEGWAGLHFKK